MRKTSKTVSFPSQCEWDDVNSRFNWLQNISNWKFCHDENDIELYFFHILNNLLKMFVDQNFSGDFAMAWDIKEIYVFVFNTLSRLLLSTSIIQSILFILSDNHKFGLLHVQIPTISFTLLIFYWISSTILSICSVWPNIWCYYSIFPQLFLQ